MVKVNENYLKLKAGYLFPEIARRVKALQESNPGAPLIRLGIGDDGCDEIFGGMGELLR